MKKVSKSMQQKVKPTYFYVKIYYNIT